MTVRLTLIVLAFLLCAPARAQDLILRAGHVVTDADTAPLENAIVVIRKGWIVAVGADIEIPDGVPLVVRPKAWIVPGFVDAASGMGLYGDRNESTLAIEADVTTRWLIDASHRDFAAARAAGISVTLVAPGDRNLFGGEGTIVTSDGQPLEGADPVAKLALGPSALRTDRPPTSRIGAISLLRASLDEAHKAVPPTTGLARFARGDVRGLVSVTSAADILSGLQLSDPYGLRVSWKLSPALEPKDLAGLPLKGMVAVVGPYTLRTGHRTLAVAAELERAGASLAFASDAPHQPAVGLRLTAALAVGAGLSSKAALRALTQGGADALGIGGEAGSLEAGKRADLAVLDGPPLDVGSRVLELYLRGKRAYRRPAPQEAGQ